MNAASVIKPPKPMLDRFFSYMLGKAPANDGQSYVSMALAADLGGLKKGEILKLALLPDDVRISEELDTFVAGVHFFGNRQDEVSAPILVDAPRFKYRRFSKNNVYKRVNLESSWQAAVPEVDPETDLVDVVVLPRALGSFIPAVTESVPGSYDPAQAASMRIRMALDLDREKRVWDLLTTSGSWAAANRTTLGAGFQWNGGVNSDPIKDLQDRIEASAAPVTGIYFNPQVSHAFLRHAKVRDHMRQMLGDAGAAQIAQGALAQAATDYGIPGLPPFHVVPGKILNETTSALDFILNDSVVLATAPGGAPSPEQIQTCATFRLRGPSGTGFTSREFFEDRRGLDGGRMLVQGHAEVVVMISDTAGGAIFDVIQ